MVAVWLLLIFPTLATDCLWALRISGFQCVIGTRLTKRAAEESLERSAWLLK